MNVQQNCRFPILRNTSQIFSRAIFFSSLFPVFFFFLSHRAALARSTLIEIIFRLLRRLAAHSVIFLRHETPATTILDLQEALVAVRHAVGAAHGIVIRRTDLLTAAEQEALDASLHGYHVHVFPAIVPLHFALVAIELVIGAANKLTFPAADLVAERGGATMLRRNLNHPLAASLPPQMAEGPINVAVASTNWFLGYIGAILGALFGLLQGRAFTNVSQLDTL